MATTHNYTFDEVSRIGNDPCGISERDMQNQQFGSYLTQNHWASNCGMTAPINFATSQPNVYYTGGVGVTESCTVDNDSRLRIGSTQTNPKCRITLLERPFKTVPFLGRGPGNPVLESKLMQGANLSDKKSCKQITEKSFRNTDVQLVPTLKATIQNANNLVEGVAADGWIRGGLPSRELTRDMDYFKRKHCS
tara:strand:- start:5145 stop:5723 length:579 start_codon:yes stop_codon:yes gene_type:complete